MENTGKGRVGSKQWAEGGKWKAPERKEQTKRIVIKHSLLSEKTAIQEEVLGQFHNCKSLTNLQYLVNISSVFVSRVGNHNPWEKILFTKKQN